MSKTRKSGNRYGESPSTRNRLSGAFIEALAEQWREHGGEILDGLRRDNPAKFAEIVAKLVTISEPTTDDTFDFKKATSMQDIGRKLLMSVGFEEPDEASIQRAIEVNNRFIEQLEAIRDSVQEQIQ
jgi:hypothetical protein